MLALALSDSTVHGLGQVVVAFLWQGALVWLLAACLLYVLPIRTAQARYAFYAVLLVLLAACPLATWCGIAGASSAVEDALRRTDVTAAVKGVALANDDAIASAPNEISAGAIDSLARQRFIGLADAGLFGATPWLARQHKFIVTGWLAGMCLMTVRLLLGAIGVRRLRMRSKPLPAKLRPLVERLSRQLAFRVAPAVHEAERISQAMAVGILKPLVLVPAGWISELPRDVLEAVIAHELAHLRRWDLLANLLQRLVETVLFFHPAVWWCSRRLRIEREMCCDELAQAALGSRVVYAKALAFLGHQQCSTRESLLVAGIGGSKMMLLERIRNVLGMTPGQHGRLYGPSCALVGATVASLAWFFATELPHSQQAETAAPQTEVATKAEPIAPPQVATVGPTEVVPEPSVEHGDTVTQPLTLENLQAQSYRDLTLDETIKIAMANSKVLRSLEGLRPSPPPKGEAGQTDLEQNLVDYELAVLNLVADAEAGYWELMFAFRNLETSNTALNSARRTWQKIYASYRKGSKGGEATAEAKAREQFYQFKCQAQAMLGELCRAENRLRYLMGLAASDDQLIRPIDHPRADKVKFDWIRLTHDALAHNPDLRRQRSRVKRQELELIATTKTLPRDLQRKGLPDDSLFQEWALGTQAIIPIGLRQKLATLRAQQWKLARERTRLQDEELEVSHQLADAVRHLEYNYQLSQTSCQRALAAENQLEAMQTAFDGESITIDQLLEAERRRAEAQSSYFRTLYDYQRAILNVRYRKGSLL